MPDKRAAVETEINKAIYHAIFSLFLMNFANANIACDCMAALEHKFDRNLHN